MTARCPKCHNEVVPDPKTPGKYLCHSCKVRYSESRVIFEDDFDDDDDDYYYPEDDHMVAEGDYLDPRGRQIPREQRPVRSSGRRNARMEGEVVEETPGNVFGVLAVIFALVGLILAALPFAVMYLPVQFPENLALIFLKIGIFGAIPGGLAFLFGLIGIIRGVMKGSKKGSALAGIMIGLIAAALAVLGMLMVNRGMAAAGSGSGSEGNLINELPADAPVGNVEISNSNSNSNSANRTNANASSGNSNASNANASNANANSNASGASQGASPVQQSSYTPGAVNNNVYANNHFGVSIVPAAGVTFLQGDELVQAASSEVRDLDAAGQYDVRGEVVAQNGQNNTKLFVITGKPAAFSAGGAEDAWKIADGRAAVISQAHPDYTVTREDVSVAGIVLPGVVVVEPNGKTTIRAFGTNNGYVAEFMSEGATSDGARAAFAMIAKL